MTIAILMKKESQNVARPYSRAEHVDELVALLDHRVVVEAHNSGCSAENLRRIIRHNVDTEIPVLQTSEGRVRFYAFTETIN